MTIADVFVKDDALVPNNVAGAVVTVLNPSTSAVITQATTDSDGRAALSVPDATYEIRIFKVGYTTPVSLIEVDASEDNVFDATMSNLSLLPVATDPRLCRCTGVFVDFSNRPRKGVVFRVSAVIENQTPKLVDGRMVFEDSMTFTSDEDGVISIDLLRGGEFYVMFAGEDDVTHMICVPDRSSVNLIDLIHPAPALLVWNQDDAPGNAISVNVGETVEVRAVLTLTSFNTISEDLQQWISFTNSDGSKVEATFQMPGTLLLRGVSPGSVEVSAEPNALPPSRIPSVPLVVTPLEVTVP